MGKSTRKTLTASVDRIKELTIVALVSDDEFMSQLVLKGGNALGFLQPTAVRRSIDLDFSIAADFSTPIAELRARIEGLLVGVFQTEGLQPIDVLLERAPALTTPDVVGDFWSGYKLMFKVVERATFDHWRERPDKQRIQAIVVGPAARRTFKVDISGHEYCEGKEAHELHGYRLYVYSAPMIVFEKVRAICQQMEPYRRVVHSSSRSPRARDFFDIHQLVTSLNLDLSGPGMADLLAKIFAAKRVPLELIGSISAERDFHRDDFSSVRDTVDASVRLHEFDHYVDFVVDRLRALQPLWEIDSPRA